ncbi:MAG: hypothetical protein ED859_14495 [Desulfuromonadales bacterium]|nr:MAG: hypothetical protein ED859_14495 [Desulfuromonadales bacterium]
MRNIRFLAFSLLLGASIVLGGQIACAGGSPPTEISWSVDLPANWLAPGVCAFPINVSVSGNAATIILPGNRSIITAPGQQAVVTNLADPSKSVQLNIPGTFHQTTKQNGDVVTVVTGRNLLGDPQAGFVLAIGTFSYIFDSSGNLIQPLTGKGKLNDVCAMIQ